ncbi:MAG: hypothetical protein Tsb002_35770 [Wenzhouxiangellaceae bacterium]
MRHNNPGSRFCWGSQQWRIFSVVLLISASAHLAAHELPTAASGCVRYLGNEGLVISAGDSKILFDAFFTNSYGQYTLVPEAQQRALLAGEPPYDAIDALFVSHVHGDHFSAQPTMAYLLAQPQVELYASQQVVDVLLEQGGEQAQSLKPRLHGFRLQVGDEPKIVTAEDLQIDMVRIPHAGGEARADIENLAFRVALDDQLTVMHMGDADPEEDLFAPYQDHWDARALDMAFPPYWFMNHYEGIIILEQRLKAGQVVGIHVPEKAVDDPPAWKQKYQGDLFIVPGEVRVAGDASCAD